MNASCWLHPINQGGEGRACVANKVWGRVEYATHYPHGHSSKLEKKCLIKPGASDAAPPQLVTDSGLFRARPCVSEGKRRVMDKPGFCRTLSHFFSHFGFFRPPFGISCCLSTYLRVRRIELRLQPWEGRALPLRHTRGKVHPIRSNHLQAWALIFSTSTFLAAVPTTCSRTVPCLKKRSVGML